MSRVCVIWPRFGPYHLARLGGAHAHPGVEVVGLEVASRDATYEWNQETGTTPWAWEVALPGRVYDEVPPQEIEAAVTDALDRIAPEAVAAMTYSTPESWAALRWARRNRRVAVMMSETRAVDAPRVGWREAVKGQIARGYDAAFVGGRPHRAYARTLGFADSAIATPYDVVDNHFFAAGADRARAHPEVTGHLPGLDDDTPFFLASNRFIPRKNLDGLLAAYERYRQRTEGTPWRLLMLGDGDLRADLERQAGDGVVFCGFQQRDALPAYYGLASAFVHPAHMDQWGLVVNEAMAAGLPALVSTGTGCAPDLVREGETGWTFAPTDLDALAERLRQTAALSEAGRLAMGQAARKHIAAYSPEAWGAGLAAAVAAGQPRADRGLPLGARLALALLSRASRRVGAFHSIPD